MKAALFISILLFPTFCGIGQPQKDAYREARVHGVFEPDRNYRDFDATNLDLDSFTGLFVQNGMFHLRPTKIVLNHGVDDCSGLQTVALIPDSDGCVFLFYRMSGHNTLPIEAVEGGEKIDMAPGKHFEFVCGNTVYTFEAKGEMVDGYIKNYTLSLGTSDRSVRQILIAHDLIEYTVVSILFIGDLDGDGEPDVILDGADNYENRRIILLLSSTKGHDEILHLEAENFEWFDC